MLVSPAKASGSYKVSYPLSTLFNFTSEFTNSNLYFQLILTGQDFSSTYLQVTRTSRKFAMFFMVLDLRLVKIGCRETINFFVISPYISLSEVLIHSGRFLIYSQKINASAKKKEGHCLSFFKRYSNFAQDKVWSLTSTLTSPT